MLFLEVKCFNAEALSVGRNYLLYLRNQQELQPRTLKAGQQLYIRYATDSCFIDVYVQKCELFLQSAGKSYFSFNLKKSLKNSQIIYQ